MTNALSLSEVVVGVKIQ